MEFSREFAQVKLQTKINENSIRIQEKMRENFEKVFN